MIRDESQAPPSEDEVTAVMLLQRDGMPVEQAGTLIFSCRVNGKDPMAFAGHLLELRAALR